MTIEMAAANIDAAVSRLTEAHATGRPCPPVRDVLHGGTVDDAYAVQQRVLAAISDVRRRRVGRKIGLTSRAVQSQFGVNQPDFGVLFADMAFGDEEPIPMRRLLQPRVEAEIAFVLGRDLTELPVSPVDVLRATEFVVAAIEVVDSRIEKWDISILDTVADNASSGVYVLGGRPRALGDVDVHDVRMSMTRNGEEVTSGTGAACLGHPVNAVVWLANAVAERGSPLQAGELVLSGSLGMLVEVRAGDVFEAVLEPLGSVRAVFSPA